MTGQRSVGSLRNRRVFTLVVAVATTAGAFALMGTSSADVTAVSGRAFGVSAQNLTLGGGAQPAVGPRPVVTLPAGGSAAPVTATEASESVGAGPATFFSSGRVDVSTQGTTGPTGSVTSTATVNAISTAGGGQLSATSASSTCRASETGVSASTTIVGGVVNTATDAGGNVTATQPVPTNPTVGFAISGTLVISATDTERFTYFFNEQTTNPDGSITVTAVHLALLGPFAKGDLFVGQSTCGVTAVSVSTTTTRPSTTTTQPSTTTTQPSTTTTTTRPSSTTTTTRPSSTTTTTRPSSTTTTTRPSSTTTTEPSTTTTEPSTTTTTRPSTTTTTRPVATNERLCQRLLSLRSSPNPQTRALVEVLLVRYHCQVPVQVP